MASKNILKLIIFNGVLPKFLIFFLKKIRRR